MSKIRRTAGAVQIEGDTCSAGARAGRNDDYAIYVPGVGGCVADGVGGAPLGDAIARFACHLAMCALCDGSDAMGALEKAREGVREFVRTVNLPSSGASIMIVQLAQDALRAAWTGDVGLFARVMRNGTYVMVSSLPMADDHMRPLGVGMQGEPGMMFLPLDGLSHVAACTDGVWRRTGRANLARILETASSAREAAARLVLGESHEDDATAMVLRFAQSCTQGKKSQARETVRG